MPSSVVRSFSYAAPEHRLDVVFTSGRRYSYHKVPQEEFDAMRASFSKGKYFNDHIRGRYDFTRTPEPAASAAN